MSGNADAPPTTAPKTPTQKLDRRVRRTRDTLGDALIELMQETDFDSITVQNVLDRAGVGRSTFYEHYRDKNDLFLSDVEDFFEMMSTLLTRKKASPQRVAPVRELFAHVGESRELLAAFLAAGKLEDVFQLGQGFFARSIEERLIMAGIEMQPMLLKARAHALAGAMIALLNWWLDRGQDASPEEMDAHFHQMVWAGIGPKAT